MTSEHAIPALKPTSTKFPFWETAVRRHLDGVDILAGDPGWGSWLGILVGIIHLLYIAQVTWKQITYAIARSPKTRKDSAASIQLQTERPCLWCTGNDHSSDTCYAKDPANLKLFPNQRWPNGEAPNYFKHRFNKKFTQEEAQKMTDGNKEASEKRHSDRVQQYKASMDSTPPPPGTSTANPSDNNASSSVKTNMHRQEGRYNYLVPEAIKEQEIAMEANYW
jgi:hypothetical protein